MVPQFVERTSNGHSSLPFEFKINPSTTTLSPSIAHIKDQLTESSFDSQKDLPAKLLTDFNIAYRIYGRPSTDPSRNAPSRILFNRSLNCSEQIVPIDPEQNLKRTQIYPLRIFNEPKMVPAMSS